MRRVSGFLGLVVAAALAACGSSGAGAPTDAAETPAATDVVEAEAVEAVEIADVAETVDAVEATDAAELPEAPSYALDDVLRVNQLQAKGTHNSYHIAPPDPIPEWNYTHAPLDVQLQQQGVRQVELDVHWTADGYHVYHVPYGDPNSTCDRFVDCLGIVKTWSDAHPGHHLLFILVEPKDDIDDEKITGTRWDQLDGEIRSVWPAGRLLTPDDVRGTHATLREALEADGWPTLGATRNRAMFAMLDSGAHRDDYLAGHPTLEGRAIFARDGLGEPYGAFLEYGNAGTDAAAILDGVQKGYLVRTTVGDPGEAADSAQAKATAALANGAQLISTDDPSAAEGPGGWFFSIPDGNPSRCNVVNAPQTCTSKDIENLGN